MSIVVDVILVAIVLFIVYKSYSKGFVATCLDTFSVFISGIASFGLCGSVADSVYNLFVEDLVKTEFARALDDLNKGTSLPDKITAMVDALPSAALQIAEYTGINIDILKSTVTGATTATDEQLIEIVTGQIAHDLMIGVVEVICFFVLFVLISLLLRFFANFFSHVLEKIPLVGGLDSLLGIVFGLVKGYVILLALGVLLGVIVATAGEGSPLLVIEDSAIYGFISNFNPTLEFVG